MRFIPSFVHGFGDYLYGLTLATAPWIFGFDDNSVATSIAVILGVLTLLYSLLTNYELGVLRVIPFRIHLLIDVLLGLFLFAAPWLFGFSDRYAEPFFGFAMVAVASGLLTDPHVLGFKRLKAS